MICSNIPVRKIQNIAVFIQNKIAQLSLDSGCEGDCIRESECIRLGLDIQPLDKYDTQLPTQADGLSSLEIVGKVKFDCDRGKPEKLVFHWEGFVCKNLQSAILCGGAFMERNKVVQELHNKRIVVDDKFYILETPTLCPNPIPDLQFSPVNLNSIPVVPPHSYIDIHLPDSSEPNQTYLIRPSDDSAKWKPQTVQAIGNLIKFQNNSENFLSPGSSDLQIAQMTSTKKHHSLPPDINNFRNPQEGRHPTSALASDQFTVQVPTKLSRPTSVPDFVDFEEPLLFTNPQEDRHPTSAPASDQFTAQVPTEPSRPTSALDFLKKININKNLSKSKMARLFDIHRQYSSVFDGDLSEGYNGFSGNYEVDFNFRNGIPPPIHLGCVPSYNKREDDVLVQAKIDELETNNIVAKAKDLRIIPKYASPVMLVQKHSSRSFTEEEYQSLSVGEKLKHNRLVLCQNKLNEYIEKIPYRYKTIEETINIVGAFEFFITSDLTDSFWQRHITPSKLPYFAFHSPFKGTYIFLRSSQGFINQSEDLEGLVSFVLHEYEAAGWCRVHADNIYVGGHNEDETIGRWKLVLHALSLNNLKLSPNKTSIFPAKLDLLGWTKEGKFLVPDPHRQNCLSLCPLPQTIKQLRSYIGGYRTFIKCQPNMSANLHKLEEFVSKYKKSTDKLEWTDDLIQSFENSKERLKTLDKLYIPKPEDQLVLTSDWSKKGYHATLWAVVDGKFLVVARMSGKPVKAMEDDMQACDGEVKTAYLAAKNPSFYLLIKSSKHKTVSLLDNKTGVQAANLINKGKFSSSKIINELLSCMSELNLEFQHMSGKLGQNFLDDFGSRNPATCSGEEYCKICSFVKSCSDLKITVAPILSFEVSNRAVIGAVEIDEHKDTAKLINEIIRGSKPMPFNNRKAMKFLQDKDPDLVKTREYLVSAQRPQVKNTKVNSIKRYLQENITISKDGCLVISKIDKKFNKRELVVIPENMALGLLYSLHWKLNHPSPYQLAKVVETKFFMLDREKKIKKIWEDCTLCQSIVKLPTKITEFQPNEIPSHPGEAFTLDIMKLHKKNIIVATENFSGFLSTQIIPSEKRDDIIEGIISTVTPFMDSDVSIRVDQAPSLKSLIKKPADLSELGITLQPGETKNKNALALVDRKMQELQKEIKLCAPSHNVINAKILAKATLVVNSRVRGSGLSSKEILFSRDQFTHENIQLDDKEIAKETMEKRKINNEHSARSKAKIKTVEDSANAKEGNIVFLKNEGDKTKKRDLYLVTEVFPSNNTAVLCKLANCLSDHQTSFQPHNFSYVVKQTDIYLAPNQPVEVQAQIVPYDISDHVLEQLPPVMSETVRYPASTNSLAGDTYQNPNKIRRPASTISQNRHSHDTDDDDDWAEDTFAECSEVLNIEPAHHVNIQELNESHDLTEDVRMDTSIDDLSDELVNDELFPAINLRTPGPSAQNPVPSSDSSPELSTETDSSETATIAAPSRYDSMEWDNYASDPTFLSQTPSPRNVTSPRELRQSSREQIKSQHENNKADHSSHAYNLRPRSSPSPPVSPQYFMPSPDDPEPVFDDDEDYTPGNFQSRLKRSNAMRRKKNKRNPVAKIVQQGTDSEDETPPAVKPRANRSQSVLQVPRSLKPGSA